MNDIAQFAQDVLASADEGDLVAAMIAEEATGELVLLIRAAVATVRAGVETVPVALGGRLLAERSPLRRRLDQRLLKELSGITPRSADATPLDGALAMGRASDPGRYRGLVHIWPER